MSWIDSFRGRPKVSLEERIKQTIASRGITVGSPEPGKEYHTNGITGIGKHEKDDDGALASFMTNLDNHKYGRPDYVSAIIVNIWHAQVGTRSIPMRKITATGYFPIPPDAA